MTESNKPTAEATKSTSGDHPAPHLTTPASTPAAIHPQPRRRWWIWILVGLVVAFVLYAGLPWIHTALTTVSTDDAYVNGHVTFVAPRVPGQVVRVLVDDNNRVKKGDLLVQLDKEPYQVQVNIAQAAVDAAQADLIATGAQLRGMEGQTRSLRFSLERTMEDVDNKIAELRASVAALDTAKAKLARGEADYQRAVAIQKSNAGAVSPQELDQYKEAFGVADAQVKEAFEHVRQIRVSLGLPAEPEHGGDLTEVPPDLDQTFSSVKQAQAALIEAASQLGVTMSSFNLSPKEMVTEFYKRDPQGDIDRIYAQLVKEAPAMKQADVKVLQAQRNLDQANLNLRYCDVLAEIDGVVTRRNVNPGNNVVAGQSLMAVRSLTEIWIDGNFKETQLRNLRIGQAVDLDVDMYGSHQDFKGRISGFTMGTGSTLALLPAENATGNFVKVVQRLPVRIEVTDYDPDKAPLFIGLSVTPYVHINEEPTGPDAGKFLQPFVPVPIVTIPPESGLSKPSTPQTSVTETPTPEAPK
jgi:membrane fusion protein, multidrug efflux system